jgi:hypothetical protein
MKIPAHYKKSSLPPLYDILRDFHPKQKHPAICVGALYGNIKMSTERSLLLDDADLRA